MKKFFVFGICCAMLGLLLCQGYSRGGRGFANEQTPTPRPSPSPTPAPVPVQGIISDVTPFAVSIKANANSTPQTFKVSSDTVITIGSVNATVADLKPGMIATITPAGDNTYATSIAARMPPVATPTPPATASVPGTPASPTAPQPPVGSNPFTPFGRLGQ